MSEKEFIIKSYGKSELAMIYFPDATSAESALKRLKYWMKINPRLRPLLKVGGKSYQPKHVRQMVREWGKPFENEDDKPF